MSDEYLHLKIKFLSLGHCYNYQTILGVLSIVLSIVCFSSPMFIKGTKSEHCISELHTKKRD